MRYPSAAKVGDFPPLRRAHRRAPVGEPGPRGLDSCPRRALVFTEASGVGVARGGVEASGLLRVLGSFFVFRTRCSSARTARMDSERRRMLYPTWLNPGDNAWQM